MRKKINTITLILYFIAFAGAVYFGWYDVKTIGSSFRAWPISVGLLACMLIIGIIRHGLLKRANRLVSQSQDESRVVSINSTEVVGNSKSTMVTDKLALIHLDETDNKEVLIKVYKQKHVVSDSVSTIVNK